ncbi:hypothetical protein STEG23_032997 [Scotinomys teguina]
MRVGREAAEQGYLGSFLSKHKNYLRPVVLMGYYLRTFFVPGSIWGSECTDRDVTKELKIKFDYLYRGMTQFWSHMSTSGLAASKALTPFCRGLKQAAKLPPSCSPSPYRCGLRWTFNIPPPTAFNVEGRCQFNP